MAKVDYKVRDLVGMVPRAFLRRVRPDLKDAEINDIANLAFIGSGTNRHITDKAPARYRTDYVATDLAAQLIDFDNGLDQAAGFERFTTARRAAIAKRLNQFLGVGGSE